MLDRNLLPLAGAAHCVPPAASRLLGVEPNSSLQSEMVTIARVPTPAAIVGVGKVDQHRLGLAGPTNVAWGRPGLNPGYLRGPTNDDGGRLIQPMGEPDAVAQIGRGEREGFDHPCSGQPGANAIDRRLLGEQEVELVDFQQAP